LSRRADLGVKPLATLDGDLAAVPEKRFRPGTLAFGLSARFPVLRRGGRLLFDRRELDAWVRAPDLTLTGIGPIVGASRETGGHRANGPAPSHRRQVP